jgi:hypothetical protein
MLLSVACGIDRLNAKASFSFTCKCNFENVGVAPFHKSSSSSHACAVLTRKDGTVNACTV